MHLGRVGLWTFQLDLQPATAAKEAAAELEELGYPALWVPEAVGRDPLVNSALLLSAKALGSHPYFVPVEHTAFARDVLGDDAAALPMPQWRTLAPALRSLA